MATEANNTQADNNNAEDTKVSFDERQQARINELIREKQAEATRELCEELERTRQQVSRLRAQINGREPLPEAEALHNEISQLRASAQVRDQQFNELQKRIALQSAIGKHHFHDGDQVLKLIADSVGMEANKLVVLDQHGQVRRDASLEPLTVHALLRQFASEHPEFVRGDTPSNDMRDQAAEDIERATMVFGPRSDCKLATKLYRTNRPEYMRLREIAIRQRIIAG